MQDDNTTLEMIKMLVDEFSEKYSDIDRKDHELIVSTTLDNYFSEEGVRYFYATCVEKLKLPVVMNYIRENTHEFFYIESHFVGDDGYRMLEDIPIEELQQSEVYSPYVDMFAGIRDFIDSVKKKQI